MTNSRSWTVRLSAAKSEFPAPELSCVLNDCNQRMQALGEGKECWFAKGPARDAYETIAPEITKLLTDRRRDLFKPKEDSHQSNSIDCYMVGSEPARSFPRIVIACQSRYFCEKSRKLIKKTDWWREFKKDYPAFGFLCMQLGPQRYASVTGAGPCVYQIGNSRATSGQHIIFDSREEVLEDSKSVSLPRAMLGGFLNIDGKVYGTTVAHPLSHQISKSARLSESCHEAWSNFEDDGEDDGYDSDSDSSDSAYSYDSDSESVNSSPVTCIRGTNEDLFTNPASIKNYQSKTNSFSSSTSQNLSITTVEEPNIRTEHDCDTDAQSMTVTTPLGQSLTYVAYSSNDNDSDDAD